VHERGTVVVGGHDDGCARSHRGTLDTAPGW
jgi:hypothetical protein